MLQVDVKLFDDLAAVAADAGDSLDRAHQVRLFDRLDWFRLIAAHVPGIQSILIARAQAGDDRCWLFLRDHGGGRAEALACWYTLEFAPVLNGARDPLVRAALLAATAKALNRRLWWITLAPLNEGDCGELEGSFAASWSSVSQIATITRQQAVAGGFEAWWKQRPGRLRNTVRRKARATDFRVEIADHFDPSLWHAYETVYEESWKPAEGAPAMLRALAETEGAAGTLRLGVAWCGEAPVAAQFWLVENGVATIHKLAHVESAASLSPGTVLTAAMFRHILDRDRPGMISFGTGDDPYKADWLDDRKPLWRLDLFRRSSPRGLARIVRARLASLVRKRRGG